MNTEEKLTDAMRTQLASFLTNGATYTSVTSDLSVLEALLALGFVKRCTYSGQTATWNLIWNITPAGKARYEAECKAAAPGVVAASVRVARAFGWSAEEIRAVVEAALRGES